MDPRYQATPSRQNTTDYQDLQPSTTISTSEEPYTALQKNQPSERADVPEYLELYDDPSPRHNVFNTADEDTEYSTLDEPSHKPSGKKDKSKLKQVRRLSESNEYSYAAPPQFKGDCNTNNAGNQYIKDPCNEDATGPAKENPEMENAYYSLPPDAQ